MLSFSKHSSLNNKSIPFGAVLVHFSAGKLCVDDFRKLAESEIAALKEKYPAESYDRKAMWGDNPYYRYFKKFKKTYPVMLQFESAVLKGRPFPAFNPVSEVAFLAELTTFALSGTHDAGCIAGDVMLYISDCREDFDGLRETLHTYPNDLCGRDDKGIVFSLIAGTDLRTSAKPDSRCVLYPVFGTPDMPHEEITNVMSTIERYAKVLCPDAEISCRII